MSAGDVGPWWRLVRFGFRLLYNEMAWTYDTVSGVVSLGQWRRWQNAALPRLNTSGTVLEVAHGTANLQVDMAAEGIESVALDISPYMGRIAQRKLAAEGLPARLVRASALEMPFRDGSFSSVVTTFPTPFFMEPNTLREVHRVLQPGGRYVIVPSAVLDLTGIVPRFLEWLYEITGQRGDVVEGLTENFAEAGFRTTIETDKLKSSQVWVIVAEKRGRA